MKLVRAVSIVAIVLLALVAGAVAAAAAFGERLLAAGIERAGPALLGREVRVGGVSIDWGLRTAVAATDLAVADAPWSAADAPMLRVRRVELAVDLLDLLRLRVAPERLALRQPALRLARDAQGRWNLPAAGSVGGGNAPGGGSLVEVAAPRAVEVEGGEVTVDDLASPGVEARIAALSVRGAPGGVEFRGTANRGGGAPLAFSGEAGPVSALFGGGEGDAKPYPVRLAVGPDTARVSAAGRIARPLELTGVDLRVEAQGDDLAPLLAAFAVPVASTPPFGLAARLADAGRGWALRDVAARLGGSRLEGTASVLLAERPKPTIKFDLAAPRIVPSDFGWLGSAGGGGGAPSGSWTDAELPTALLGRADAEGDLRVERLEGPAAEPARLRVGIGLKDGRLGLQPLRLELAGAVVEGNAAVEAAAGDGAQPRAELRLEADGGLRLGPPLAALGVDQVTGTLASASVDLRGQGTTPRGIAAGLDGAARFRIADGSLRVPGLANLSMGLFETFGAVLGIGGDAGATPVACAIGDLPVQDGVVRTERLVVVTPRVAISGEGEVRLGDGTLRLTLTPRPLDEALVRVVVPVVVSGGLASPEVAPHPELRVGARPEPAADVCAEEAGRR